MSASESAPSTLSPEDLALQQELRGMFVVDSLQQIQFYSERVQTLQSQGWASQIQDIYRSIHTIKGSAATVGADPVLQVSAVLEDLLSELRYLDPAPPLDDGRLRQSLLEAGELLSASMELRTTGEKAIQSVAPSVERIRVLHQQMRDTFLPEWNELTQVHQEFAEQGFDLVVLDWEMAVEELPPRGVLPSQTLAVAQRTLRQLAHIGKDLQLGQGWKNLLRRSQILIQNPDCAIWQHNVPLYLRLLKDCARHSGIVPVQRSPQPVVSAPTLVPMPQEGISPVRVDPLESPAVQVAIPLPRLDQAAQNLVETLLTAQTAQGTYQGLQQQLTQLVALSQESVQYITQLRQIQDDYALLNTLQVVDPTAGPAPERYRQGYSTINRLLETSLRLSELGAEVEKSAHKTGDSLQKLDHTLLRLQQTIEDSRLVPFRTVGLKARGIVRDLVTRYGKSARLSIEGEGLELDAGTVQLLEPALLHLLRNAYDHGLESESERLALGKPSEGSIFLTLHRRGDQFTLVVGDDGQGIDAQHIHQLAQAKGLPLTRTSTPAELLAVICQPGFSRQEVVSEVSGRGVGMDVVRHQIDRMGGSLTLDTQVGSHTRFTLVFSVQHLLVTCLLLQVGPQVIAIPAEEIFTTHMLGSITMRALNPRLFEVEWGEDRYPGLDLRHYWQLQSDLPPLSDTAIALRTQAGSWLLVDELLGKGELLIQSLPDPLVAPQGLIGVSLQGDGHLLPVLDPRQLLQSARPTLDPKSLVGAEPAKQAVPNPASMDPSFPMEEATDHQTILVVDDAALVRRRLEVSLGTNGYRVTTCTDGMEAWNWLQTHGLPSLLITDIEMPIMDGFTLIDRCRQQGWQFPVLVISSRLAQEWSREARRLGATDYLTKGFSTAELIEKVQALVPTLPMRML